jgi:hypothetical protein
VARITLTYQCGHTERTTGPGRQAAYLQNKASCETCWPCRRDAQNTESAAQAAESGLAPLSGKSDRQIAFGETCRAEMVETILDMHLPETERGRILKWLASQTDAGWWCDLRQHHRGNVLIMGIADTGEYLAREYWRDTGIVL